MKVLALCLEQKSKLQKREVKKPKRSVTRSSTDDEKSIPRVTLPELQEVEKTIITCLHYEHFREELQLLGNLNITEGKTNRRQARKRNQAL